MRNPGLGDASEPLLDIEREKLTGVLEIRSGDVTTRVYAKHGVVVFADAGTASEALGRVLVRSGLLTEEQYAAVIRRMTDGLIDNEHVRFGEIVVGYGFLTEPELQAALTEQVRQKIIGAILRGRAEWFFQADSARVEEVGNHPISVAPALLEAARRLPERRIEEILLVHEERYPALLASADEIAARLGLDDAHAAALASIDGSRSVIVLYSSSSPAVDVPALLAALVMARLAELAKQPQRAPVAPPRAVPVELTRPQARAPSSVLARVKMTEMDQRAMAAAISADEARRRADAALGRLFADVKERSAKRGPQTPPEPKNEHEKRLLAEAAFQAGKTHLLAEEPARALPELRRAHELQPNDREYELFAAWAAFRCDRAMADESRRLKMRRLATDVLKHLPECAIAFHILGYLALNDHQPQAAQRLFGKAFELAPWLTDAGRQLRLLAKRESEPSAPAAPAAPRSGLSTPIEEIIPAIMRKLIPKGR